MTPPNATQTPQPAAPDASQTQGKGNSKAGKAPKPGKANQLAIQERDQKLAPQTRSDSSQKVAKSKLGFFNRFQRSQGKTASSGKNTATQLQASTADGSKLDRTLRPQASKTQNSKLKIAPNKAPKTPPASPEQSTSLNASSLVLGWFKAYPGLWLSPLALGLLGGWVMAQPDPNSIAQEATAETSLASEALETEPQLPPFVSREAQPLGPPSPFGETDAALLADPPDDADLAKAALKKNALDKAAQANGTASALPGVPTASPQSPDGDLESQLKAQVSSANQAQTAADAKFVLEERAKAQAAAFAQAKANQAASNTPPQPAPPIQGNPAVDQMIIMQVAIAEGDTTLTMGGSNQSVIMTQAGEPLLQLNTGTYGMQCDGSGLLLNGQKLPATVMMAPLGGGLNYVRDRTYRGQIQFICQGNTVLAVNHIDMLNYLYSVVGSEVSPSWPVEALKAQSVAARSYALTYYFRPAKKHFHIGDTESYQVYKGTVSEDARVKAAVQATAGEFISYGGGIVESLYAASDDIVMEAFQGGGMSQLGALDFAKQGYNYLQILGYYYPQTSLGRMVLEDGA